MDDGFCLTACGQTRYIIDSKHGDALHDPPSAILQPQHAAWTDAGADAAADTAGALDVHSALRIGTHVNAHLAIGRAVATRDALPTVGGDAEA